MAAENQSKVYPSVAALAEELGMSRPKVYEFLRSGAIPRIRIGKKYILPRAAIDEWLKTAGASTKYAALPATSRRRPRARQTGKRGGPK